MIIESSNISFSVEHEKYQFSERSSSLDAFKMELNSAQLRLSDGVVSEPGAPLWAQLLPTDGAEIMDGIPSLFSNGETQNVNPVERQRDALGSSLLETHDRLFQALLAALTERLEMLRAGTDQSPTSEDSTTADAASAGAGSTDTPSTSITAAATRPSTDQPLFSAEIRTFSLNVQITEFVQESEVTDVQSNGVINTLDGRAFDFNMNLVMSRSYEATREYQQTQEILFKDPLIVNFDGNSAELTEQQYEFDIDADGEMDWISLATGSSGLLALDQNGDGIINDGSELFGAISGDGFSDLSIYDEDNNGFIDEADSIFEDLMLWNKNGEEDQLASLSDQNVGAIYLGSIESPFDLKDDSNNIQGQVRETGIYLSEEGEVGSVQQIDLAV
ncbi:MAG: hypothetical protein OQK12_08920 [Motiliproteus sp.]|nr:hypothetical protein [Motiliproteus sp.]MCW9052726.1 hypothetical protein [Motiliproteus sp.]